MEEKETHDFFIWSWKHIMQVAFWKSVSLSCVGLLYNKMKN